MSTKPPNYPDKIINDTMKTKNWIVVKGLINDNSELKIKDVLIDLVKIFRFVTYEKESMIKLFGKKGLSYKLEKDLSQTNKNSTKIKI